MAAPAEGLGTDVNLRHHFIRLVGVAPTHYRRTFKDRQERPFTALEPDARP
jgi:transcriptional regulator GlxA family with amidase domain